MPNSNHINVTKPSIFPAPGVRTWFTGMLLVLSWLTPLAAQALELRWVGCGITRKAFMQNLAKAYEAKTGIRISAEGGGATRGIRDVAKGKSHMGGSCRTQVFKPGGLFAIKEEAGVRMVPVAWDALVVIVHPDVPMDSIGIDQVRRIYSGEISNWQELGGENAPINLLIRKGKLSGVGRTIRALIFADYDYDFTDRAEVFPSSGPLEKRIEKDSTALGITGVSSARRRDVKILSLEGKEPSYENIKQGKYLLYRPLYLVTPPLGKNPEVDKFVKYAISGEGSKIIRNAGTVPYVEAIQLINKQRQQWKDASKQGLDRWGRRQN